LPELLDLFVSCDGGEADLGGDLAVHLDDGGELLFGEQEDLEHEVFALLRAAAEARLAHEDEAGEEDAFHGDEGGEEREGEGIEVGDGGDVAGVDEDPEEEYAEMEGDEGEAAGEACDGVAEALGGGAAGEELLLVLDDGFNVLLEMVGRLFHEPLDVDFVLPDEPAARGAVTS